MVKTHPESVEVSGSPDRSVVAINGPAVRLWCLLPGVRGTDGNCEKRGRVPRMPVLGGTMLAEQRMRFLAQGISNLRYT